jgi:hypothetical protein
MEHLHMQSRDNVFQIGHDRRRRANSRGIEGAACFG